MFKTFVASMLTMSVMAVKHQQPALNAVDPNYDAMWEPQNLDMINPNFDAVEPPNFDAVQPNFDAMWEPQNLDMINPNFDAVEPPNLDYYYGKDEMNGLLPPPLDYYHGKDEMVLDMTQEKSLGSMIDMKTMHDIVPNLDDMQGKHPTRDHPVNIPKKMLEGLVSAAYDLQVQQGAKGGLSKQQVLEACQFVHKYILESDDVNNVAFPMKKFERAWENGRLDLNGDGEVTKDEWVKAIEREAVSSPLINVIA